MNQKMVLSNAIVPRVLVLMATRNGEHWLDEQMTSIFAQRGVELFVRVSDDCSSDGTIALLDQLSLARPNLDVGVRAVGSGSAGANFKGLLATSDFTGFDCVALADQDDVWMPDHLQLGCAALAANPSLGGYSCAVRTFGSGDQAVHAQNPKIRTYDYLFEGAGQGCTFVFTADLAQRVQQVCRDHPVLVAALHYHDWLIYLISRCSGRGWTFDSIATLNYRQHGANEIGARSGRGSLRKRLALIRDGWFKKQIGAALALAVQLAPTDPDLTHFRRVFEAQDSLARRLRMAGITVGRGRRRAIDRLVLAFSAIVGWF
jgi:rhamnosyltransferase